MCPRFAKSAGAESSTTFFRGKTIASYVLYFHFEDEFDIPLDGLELAAVSPGLSDRFRLRLPRIDMLEQREHLLENHQLRRVWRFRPGLAIPKPALRLAKKLQLTDSWAVTESGVYGLRNHSKAWKLSFTRRDDAEERTFAEGEYGLFALGRGRSRRVATGNLSSTAAVNPGRARSIPGVARGIRGVGNAFDAYLVSLLRTLYEAEAQSLRELVSLV